MKRSRIALSLVVAGWLAPQVAAAEAVKVDASIPPYQDRQRRGGQPELDRLRHAQQRDDAVGRDLPAAKYPNVRIQIEGKGSSTAPPALIAGTAQLGPMSREMKPTEIDDFEKKFGYTPTAYKVAVDALAVYVNKDNPLEQAHAAAGGRDLLEDAPLRRDRRRSRPGAQLGLTGHVRGTPISLYGRNSASGTYGYFKEHALCNGDFRTT